MGFNILRAKTLLLICCPVMALAESDSRPILYNLNLEAIQYLSDGQPYFRDDAANTNLSLMFQTLGDLKYESGFGVAWDLDMEYSAVENWNYFRPHELNVSLEKSFGNFWFGRKKFVYSAWEERWNQALFQPRFMDDKLRSTTAGLVGLFAEKKFQSVRLRGGFLPISIPEMGPNYWVADGDMVSKNPWFNPPPASFQYGGLETAIDYSVFQPDVWSAISKPGGVAQMEYDVSENVLSRTSYAYKPMPQIILGFPFVLLLPGTGYVELHPRFLYHHVINQDIVVKSDRTEYGFSAAYESPVKDNLPTDWETKSLTDATIASGYVTTTLDDAKSLLLTGSLLKVWGGDQPDSGPIKTKRTVFERRYQFTEAGSVEVRKNWSTAAWPSLSNSVKVLYDRLQNGLIYSADVTAKIGERFGARASFDFFDLGPGKISMPDGFIHVYRGNDRLSLELTYAF